MMTLEELAAGLSKEEIVSLLLLKQNHLALQKQSSSQAEEIAKLNDDNLQLKQDLNWFKRQLFGRKSEKRLLELGDSRQLSLGEILLPEKESAPEEGSTVKSYVRGKKKPFKDAVNEEGLQFDSTVPVEVIKIPNPAVEGLSEEEYEVVSVETTHRLAQRKSPYVILRFEREVIKLKSTGKLSKPAAPATVFEKSYADVSFIAGLLINKFLYHLPLNRQHQSLTANGVKLSRVTLSNLVHRAGELLQPIYYALLSSIVQSEVLLMDETTVKAGRNEKKRQMQKCYFWPILGDKGEIAFPFSPSRGGGKVKEVLEEFCGVLVSDGYKVYETFSKAVEGVVHAQCRVEEEVTPLNPRRPGRARLTHPVPRICSFA